MTVGDFLEVLDIDDRIILHNSSGEIFRGLSQNLSDEFDNLKIVGVSCAYEKYTIHVRVK